MPKGRRNRGRRRTSTRGRPDRTGRKGPRKAPEPPPDTLVRDPDAPPPVIAIVGRPNVGKSTLLNALVRSRVAIVEPTPGVTRDRVAVLCTLADRTVEVVDTGGVGIVDRQGLEAHVEAQVAQAVEGADVVLFVTDAREGVAALDRRVADLLRGARAPVVLLANKVETEEAEWGLGELEALGHGTPLAISAKERIGLDELEERLAVLLGAHAIPPRRLPPPELLLAVVGRMNAGKSSLVNALLEQERMIVSEVPGTTRDSVDVRFERDGKVVVVIDTAGIRKERIVHDSVEFYAQRRAERAIRRADVTVLVLDTTAEVARLDRKIAAYAIEHHQPVVVAANKWDLVPREDKLSHFKKHLRTALPPLRHAPVVATSATEGKGVEAVLAAAWRLQGQARTRVGTADVNKALEEAQALRAPKPYQGRRGHIYYGTQVDVAPPTFVLFVNDPELFESNYVRYLENRFRESLPFAEVPLRFFLKARPRAPRD